MHCVPLAALQQSLVCLHLSPSCEHAAADLQTFAPLGPLPSQKPPQHSKLAVKVTFRDELTGRVYDQIQEVQVKIPATKPATRTANSRDGRI